MLITVICEHHDVPPTQAQPLLGLKIELLEGKAGEEDEDDAPGHQHDDTVAQPALPEAQPVQDEGIALADRLIYLKPMCIHSVKDHQHVPA